MAISWKSSTRLSRASKSFIPKRFQDARVFFSETFRKKDLALLGIQTEFVQDNHSLSVKSGTIRGLHYQILPHAQSKLIRVVRGAILDVALDIRRGSPTFGKHAAVTLSAGAGNQVYVPPGLAHGFCTLEGNTEVIYKVDDYWFPECERGILWNDAKLGIAWPFELCTMTVSEKDQGYLPLDRTSELF